ncbi:nhl-1 [Cordylochernes scorpioides]|uniref:Nhl-1 n=1 Tax=Cordylochernes scorpioides TaxID=51811 RepID=A0ABY6JZZ0_9ARAC|nr:nhl-1 [Cordylochernes scorpioides]
MSSAWSQLDQLLTCAICLDRYRNPKLLPCQHTFCQEPCLEGLVDYARRQIKCPECRAEHRIPYQGVQSFAVNVTLMRFLELHRDITGEEPEPPPSSMERCGVCSEKAYLERCAHCEKKVCQECKEAHIDILRREINRINGQVKRGLHRLNDALSQTQKNAQKLQQNCNQVREEIEDLVKRYTKDIRDSEEKMKHDLDTYIQKEMKSINKLKDDLEVEVSNLSSNSELVEKHVNGNNEVWTDSELVEYKELFLRTLEFIRNFDVDTSDFARRIKFTPKTDPDALHRNLSDFGEIKINLPPAIQNSGQASSNALMRSQSDHRLAAQFQRRQQESKSLLDVPQRFGGHTSDSERDGKETTSFGRTRRGEFGRFGDRSEHPEGPTPRSRYLRDELSRWRETEGSEPGSFRSRFGRDDEGGDTDFHHTRTVRFEEPPPAPPPAPPKEKIFETEDATKGPLSGLIRLLDSSYIMERLHQNEVRQQNKEGERRNPETAPASPPAPATPSPPTPVFTPQPPPRRQTSRQASEDEIEKQKKQNQQQQTSGPATRSSSPPPAPSPPQESTARPTLRRVSTLQKDEEVSRRPSRQDTQSPDVEAVSSRRDTNDEETPRSWRRSATIDADATNETQPPQSPQPRQVSREESKDEPPKKEPLSRRASVTNITESPRDSVTLTRRYSVNIGENTRTNPSVRRSYTRNTSDSRFDKSYSSSLSTGRRSPLVDIGRLPKIESSRPSLLSRTESCTSLGLSSDRSSRFLTSRTSSSSSINLLASDRGSYHSPLTSTIPSKDSDSEYFSLSDESTSEDQPCDNVANSGVCRSVRALGKSLSLEGPEDPVPQTRSQSSSKPPDKKKEEEKPTQSSFYGRLLGTQSTSKEEESEEESDSEVSSSSSETESEEKPVPNKDSTNTSNLSPKSIFSRRNSLTQNGSYSFSNGYNEPSTTTTPRRPVEGSSSDYVYRTRNPEYLRRDSDVLPRYSSYGLRDDNRYNREDRRTNENTDDRKSSDSYRRSTKDDSLRSWRDKKDEEYTIPSRYRRKSTADEEGDTYKRYLSRSRSSALLALSRETSPEPPRSRRGSAVSRSKSSHTLAGEDSSPEERRTSRVASPEDKGWAARYLRSRYGSSRSSTLRSSHSGSSGSEEDLPARSSYGGFQTPKNVYLQKKKPILKFGARGSEPGCFTWPRGVAVGPDNVIVVADTQNHRVQVSSYYGTNGISFLLLVFDNSGRLRHIFGSYGSGPGEFDGLAGIAVNRIGQIIVSDRYNNRLQLFDPSGRFLRAFGSEGRTDGRLSLPWGVATDSLGFIYVCDKDNHRIQKPINQELVIFPGPTKSKRVCQVFQSDGSFVGKFGGLGSRPGQLDHPHYVAVSSANRVLVTDSDNHRVQIFDVNGRSLATFGSEGSGEGQFKFPAGVAVDEQGFIAVGDSGNNRVQLFHPDGTFLRAFGTWGKAEGEFKGLEGVAMMSNGNILVCDRENHRIQVF